MPDKNKPDDPWGRRHKEEGPPNLDELFAKLMKQLNQLDGLKKIKKGLKSNNGGKDGGKSTSEESFFLSFLFIGILAFLIWVISGIFIVSPAERGVILRFGQYQRTVNPGPHWIPRLFESVNIVNVQNISNFSYNDDMLTKDENIVFVSLSIQYRINNARSFLFNVVNPTSSLQQATASTLRQVIGNTTLDEVLTTGRQKVREDVEKQLNAVLKPYNTGLLVTDINLQPAQPPEEVTDAFDDAIKAREDEQRYINEAEAYAEKVVPIAKGQANRLLREAQAFKQKLVLEAKANTAGYLALLPEYQRAPVVTRDRMYFDTLESIFEKTSNIVINGVGNHLFYLPINAGLLNRNLQENQREQGSVSSLDNNQEIARVLSSKADQPNVSNSQRNAVYSSNRPSRNANLHSRLKYYQSVSQEKK